MNEIQSSGTYVDHLRAEHRELHAEMHRIKNAFFAEENQRTPNGKLLPELVALSDELRHHFAEEEGGGCLEEAIAHCPGVAPEADALQREHPALLKSLDHIIALLKRAAGGKPLANVEQEFDTFAKNLLVHEATENRVMQRAFGVTVNGDDEQ